MCLKIQLNVWYWVDVKYHHPMIMTVPITAIIINTFNITGISLTIETWILLKLPNNIISQTSITNTDGQSQQDLKNHICFTQLDYV